MSELFNSLKNWIMANKPSDDLTKAVDGKVKMNKVLTAEQAYTTAKYNLPKTQTELVTAFMNSTQQLIERKMNDNEFCCQVEIVDDIRDLAPQIIDYFKNKLGYSIVYLDDKTEIKNESLGENLKSEVPKNSAFMSIFWKDVKIKSMLPDKDKQLEDCITFVND